MSIKPVLVPDHTANDLRRLMDHFSEATTGPTRQELAESRAAVAAASGVSEARPDVMRHKGDKTIRVVKKGGKPIGEIGIDAEASPGNGQYYVKLYDGSYDAVGFDSAEEALAELKAAISEGRLTEFAPSDSGGDDGDDGFDEDTLRQLAAKWYNGDEDPRVEQVLMAAGWEIGQDEGYEDEPGVFVVMSGDENGKSYMSWPAEELRSEVDEGISNADQDPNLAKAYRLGNEAYRAYKTDPARAQAAQDRIEAEFPQYLKMWTTGYRDGERFAQEKTMSEASPTGLFKQGDKVKVHGKYNGTVVGQNGDTYYVQIDGYPGSQAVSAASLAKPAAVGFERGAKLIYKGQPVTYIRPYAHDPGQSYVEIASGSDELVATADLQAATVAESVDPVEQLRADIRRFSR